MIPSGYTGSLLFIDTSPRSASVADMILQRNLTFYRVGSASLYKINSNSDCCSITYTIPDARSTYTSALRGISLSYHFSSGVNTEDTRSVAIPELPLVRITKQLLERGQTLRDEPQHWRSIENTRRLEVSTKTKSSDGQEASLRVGYESFNLFIASFHQTPFRPECLL
jgi:hypothetical protein